jgi:MscS family membrane protein
MISAQFPQLANYIPNEYLRAFILLMGLIFIFKTIIFITGKILLHLASKTSSDADDKLILSSITPVTFLSILFSLNLAIKEITLSENILTFSNELIITLVAINFAYLLYVFLNNFVIRGIKHLAKKTKSEIDDSLIGILQGAIKVGLFAITLLFILDSWGIEIGPFLAGLGIAGLAVALALQPILGNIFSGIALILDQTFKVGDIIKLDNGLIGEVYKIGLRTKRIKTFDNEMIIVPNSKIADSTIQNSLQPDRSIRVNMEFSVEYGNDPEYIKKIVLEEIEKVKKLVDKNKPMQVLFTGMGASSLDFKCMFWVEEINNKWIAHQEIITRIYRRFYKENIGIPFPQSTVWLREEKNFSSPNPKDKKFDEVKEKYYSNFGKEYIEPEKEEETKKSPNILKKIKEEIDSRKKK